MSEPTTARDTNVPTTENIAKALRVCFGKTCACSECPFENESCGDIEQLAADRLESQEQTIAALTARAEQAERERDAAIKDITRRCTRCKHWTCPNDDEPCLSCVNAETGNPNWTWRGLPQEGEGK